MLNYLKYLAFAILIGFTMFGCTNKDDTYWPALAGGGAESEDNGNGNGEGEGEDVEPIVVDASGGRGAAGGALLIRAIGDVNILSSGAVNTAFTSNYAFTPDYGLVKNTVVADYTVRHDPPAETLVVGDLFTKCRDDALFVVTDVPKQLPMTTNPYEGISYERVTGLEVQAGVTLSIEVNRRSKVALSFSDDVVINGTIKPVWPALLDAELDLSKDGPSCHMPSLELCSGGHIQTGAASLITVAGPDEEVEAEETEEPKIMSTRSAGKVELDAFEGMLLAGKIDASGGDGIEEMAGKGGSIEIDSFGTIVNSGSMTVKDGDGPGFSVLGDGPMFREDKIAIHSEYHVFNTGELDARGGAIKNGRGTQPARVELVAERGSLFNAGDILATAGDGTYGGASSSHDCRDEEMDIESRYFDSQATVSLKAANDLTNSGDIEASGGSALADGPGGSAGTIELVALTGDVKSSGNLTAMGGDAKEPELTTEEARYDCCFLNYRGGFGGKIRVKVSGHDFDSIYMLLPQLSMTFGSVALSGNLSVAGGDSGLCESQVPEEIAGRFPDMHSGRGGKIEIGNYFGCFGPALNVNLLGYASIAMAGGDSNRIGGRGGVVMINVPFDEMLASNEMRSIAKQGYRSELNNLRLLGTGIVNQAALDLSGGNGVYLGGSGGKFMAASEGPLTNSGAADLAGGNGLVGGNGHDPFNRSLVVLISGTLTTNSGALILKGGDVVLPEGQDIAPEDAMVGGGGFAGLFSQKAATINSGDINVAPGSGIELDPKEFAKRVGNILIDLFDVTPPNGVLDL